MSRPLYIIATENSENQSNRMFLTDLAGSFTSHLMLTPAQESGMISLLRMSVDDSYENTSNNITALFMSNKVIMLSLSNATPYHHADTTTVTLDNSYSQSQNYI